MLFYTNCHHCNKELRNIRKDRPRKYCNNICQGNYLKQYADEQYNLNPKLCKQCQQPLTRDQKNDGNEFCCSSCAAIYTSSLKPKVIQPPLKYKLKSNDDTPFDMLTYNNKIRRIMKEQDNSCAHCHRDNWMGYPIKFQIDHIDGNRENNTRDNLEALCPTCHSFTPTWGAKNKGIK